MFVNFRCRRCGGKGSRNVDSLEEVPAYLKCRDCSADLDVTGLDQGPSGWWLRVKLARTDDDDYG